MLVPGSRSESGARTRISVRRLGCISSSRCPDDHRRASRGHTAEFDVRSRGASFMERVRSRQPTGGSCARAPQVSSSLLCAPPDWWSQTGSNRRPPACKAGALPTELWPRSGVGVQVSDFCRRAWIRARSTAKPATWHLMVGLGRFELPTSHLSSARSNQLSYKPRSRVSDIECRNDDPTPQSRSGHLKGT